MSTLIPGIKKSFRGEGSTMHLSGKSCDWYLCTVLNSECISSSYPSSSVALYV